MSILDLIRNRFFPSDTKETDAKEHSLIESGVHAKSVEADAKHLLSIWMDERRAEELRLFKAGTGNFVENALDPRRRDTHV